MARRLPPLKAVRAFEAAAPHLSFERAGGELAVTAGAIAQQVKALEGWLGVPLFSRLPSRGVVLTPAGRRYAEALGPLLDNVAEATARVQRPDSINMLTVSTLGNARCKLADSALRLPQERAADARYASSDRGAPHRLLARGGGCRHRIWTGPLSWSTQRFPDARNLFSRL